MKIQKGFPTWRLAIAAVLVISMIFPAVSMTAYAHDVPDLTRTGSFSAVMAFEGNPVPGGTLTLYRVGDIREDNGDYSFALTGEYAESGVSLEHPDSVSLAGTLAAYTSENKLSGTEIDIGEDGIAFADGLELGLYLAMQTEASNGYEAVVPFLVSIPAIEDGTYVYDVDASPKMSVLIETEPEPSRPGVPSDSVLPQTGQLNWPVPVLAISGMCLFLVGFALRSGKKGASYEE